MFFFAPCNAVKGIVGQTIDKPQVSGEAEWLLMGIIHLHVVSELHYKAGPNLGNHCAISQTQIECDS